ncbi:MAG: glycosyltransferase family 2 protein [Actinobacteria bacterium]|nr:glycosyltransferase family 2 protein [Actinomycetota bacterium]
MTVPVSVIVPTRNAAHWIGACLTGIEHNRPAEVIVVDGASEDGTREVARARADRVLDDRGAGVAAARQLGVEAATQAWVALIDADVVLGPGALAALLEEARERRLAALQAGLFSIGCGDYWSEQLARHHNRGQVRDWFGVSATLVRREVLLTHPFDRSLRSGEDIDLRLRLRAAGISTGVSQRTRVVHRFGAGYAFCRDQWLADGQGLGRMVRSHGLRALPNALIPFPAAALGALDAVGERLRPLPYFAGFAGGNWIGLLRGLRDRRVPAPTSARRALVGTTAVVVASLLVLGPIAIAAAGAAVVLLASAAYDGADWTVAVSVAGLAGLAAVELARSRESYAAFRLLRSGAWMLAIVALTGAAARLLGVIA